MQFRLYYRGPLNSNGGIEEKQTLREHFNNQLKDLWTQRPLNTLKDEWLNETKDLNHIKVIGDFKFSSIIASTNLLVAELEIIFLRPEAPGEIVTQGGDIDNRIKTLLDGLSIPQLNQLPKNWEPESPNIPIHCLLEDDNLITKLSIDVDRLLAPKSRNEVVVLIRVKTKHTVATMQNLNIS